LPIKPIKPISAASLRLSESNENRFSFAERKQARRLLAANLRLFRQFPRLAVCTIDSINLHLFLYLIERAEYQAHTPRINPPASQVRHKSLVNCNQLKNKTITPVLRGASL
jgi:hypothetical protein